MSDQENLRLNRARASLDGLSVGDAFGDRWFFHINRAEIPLFQSIQNRILPGGRWEFTDDTNMALSVFSVLRQHDHIDQDALADNFAVHFERSRGYGPAMYRLLPQLQVGVPWQRAARTLFDGQGSFGNGSAMRVAPLGAYFADDLDLAIENAKLSAEITHSHPEAIAGAIAVAVAAAWAWRLRESKPTRAEFIDHVLPSIPESEVRSRCILARDLQSTEVRAAVGTLGNGSGISCQQRV